MNRKNIGRIEISSIEMYIRRSLDVNGLDDLPARMWWTSPTAVTLDDILLGGEYLR